jgi:hypothetical protein
VTPTSHRLDVVAQPELAAAFLRQPGTWPTHYERAPEMPPNSRQQPTIASSSNLQT